MLGARTTVTPFHHQPEAQHPKKLSAIHKLPADYPIFGSAAGILDYAMDVCSTPESGRRFGSAPRPFGVKGDIVFLARRSVGDDVSADQNRSRNGQAHCTGHFRVDDEFKRCRLLDRQVGWFHAIQYLMDIISQALKDRL
jgi:hypothetical protein